MRWSVWWSSAASRELARLPRDVQERVDDVVAALAMEENPVADARKLAGSTDMYRVRVGNYRIVYSIDSGVLMILVLSVADRKDVYRRR